MAGLELPSRAIREQIVAALDLIVHVRRDEDGRRRVASIAEIVGMEGETPLLQEIFVFRRRGLERGKVLGEHSATGIVPRVVPGLRERGAEIPMPGSRPREVRAVAERVRWAVAAAACALGMVACETPTENPYDPAVLLRERLLAWQEVRDQGWSCEERATVSSPLVDCERITRDIARLAVDFPRYPDILLANASIAYATRRPDEAQAYLDRLLHLQPSHPDAAVLRSRIALEEGNLRLARRVLEEQIELVPDHAGLREALASVLYLEGDTEAAHRSLDAAEELGAPSWRVAYNRGLIAEAEGKLDEAAGYYEKALSDDPDFVRARSRLRGLYVGR